MDPVTPENLTPNPFPSGNGNQIFGDTRRVIFNTGCRGHPCPRKFETHGGFRFK